MPNAGKATETLNHSDIAGGNANVAATMENSLTGFFKINHPTTI